MAQVPFARIPQQERWSSSGISSCRPSAAHPGAYPKSGPEPVPREPYPNLLLYEPFAISGQPWTHRHRLNMDQDDNRTLHKSAKDAARTLDRTRHCFAQRFLSREFPGTRSQRGFPSPATRRHRCPLRAPAPRKPICRSVRSHHRQALETKRSSRNRLVPRGQESPEKKRTQFHLYFSGNPTHKKGAMFRASTLHAVKTKPNLAFSRSPRRGWRTLNQQSGEMKLWSHPPGSNRRPADYESAALPTELGWLLASTLSELSFPIHPLASSDMMYERE
jgi:hypothetical protein